MPAAVELEALYGPVTLELDAGVPCAGAVEISGATLGPGALRLSISPEVDEDHVPVAGAGDAGASCKIGDDRSFRAVGLGPGRYVARADHRDASFDELRFELPPGGRTDLRLRFVARQR